MKNQILLLLFIAAWASSCQKAVDITSSETVVTPPEPVTAKVLYTIKEGQQYCDKNNYVPVNITELKFKVRFDSSAIYTTVAASNQADINKLYGFSDNNALHHDFSARFGWRWYNNNLEIFGYIYNNGVVSFQKIGNASIGKEETYSIKILEGTYFFTLGNTSINMPRASTTSTGMGYKLYPYFGGDELAPHDVKIWIEEL
jgi:hypothetical protein